MLLDTTKPLQPLIGEPSGLITYDEVQYLTLNEFIFMETESWNTRGAPMAMLK